jgi:hypothetical protein
VAGSDEANVVDQTEPVIVSRLELRIERTSVVRFLDYPSSHSPPARIERLLAEILPEGRALAHARGAFVRVAPEQASAIGLAPHDAAALGLGLVTAGREIEARVGELAAAGELTRAVLLDAVGSAAAEEAADRLSALLVGAVPNAQPLPTSTGGAADAPVPSVSCRLSPGYGDWPLESQPRLFARLPHEALGVSLTPACLMVPRKSVSFAMWLGARGRIAPDVGGCSRCRLEHCRYRRARTGWNRKAGRREGQRRISGFYSFFPSSRLPVNSVRGVRPPCKEIAHD